MITYYWTAFNMETGEVKFFDTERYRDTFVSLSPGTWEKSGKVAMEEDD